MPVSGVPSLPSVPVSDSVSPISTIAVRRDRGTRVGTSLHRSTVPLTREGWDSTPHERRGTRCVFSVTEILRIPSIRRHARGPFAVDSDRWRNERPARTGDEERPARTKHNYDVCLTAVSHTLPSRFARSDRGSRCARPTHGASLIPRAIRLGGSLRSPPRRRAPCRLEGDVRNTESGIEHDGDHQPVSKTGRSEFFGREMTNASSS